MWLKYIYVLAKKGNITLYMLQAYISIIKINKTPFQDYFHFFHLKSIKIKYTRETKRKSLFDKCSKNVVLL